jgi:hypothetical protein
MKASSGSRFACGTLDCGARLPPSGSGHSDLLIFIKSDKQYNSCRYIVLSALLSISARISAATEYSELPEMRDRILSNGHAQGRVSLPSLPLGIRSEWPWA